MKRIVSLDIAKAICIVLVVVGHYMPDDVPLWYDKTHCFIYSFHMPLFMFASGFIYMTTRKDVGYWAFLWKKVKRLMVPYFVTSIIIISLKLLMESRAYVENPVTPMSYARIFCLPEAGYFLWFIWALWWMFVIAPLFKSPALRWGLLAIGIVLAYVPFRTTELFCIAQFKHMLVYFALGIVMAEHRQVIWQYARKCMPAIYVLFCGTEALLLTNSYGGGYLGRIVSFLGIASIIGVSEMIAKSRCDKVVGWLIGLSASSYIIYLFHTTFEGFVKSIVHKLNMSGDQWFVLEALCVIAAGVIGPVLLHRWVLSRFKITRLLFGLK